MSRIDSNSDNCEPRCVDTEEASGQLVAIICLAKGCQKDFCISKCCPQGFHLGINLSYKAQITRWCKSCIYVSPDGMP